MNTFFKEIVPVIFCLLLMSCAGGSSAPPANIDCNDPLISDEELHACFPEENEDLFYKMSYGSFVLNDFFCVKVIEPASNAYAFIVSEEIRTRFSGFVNIVLNLIPNLAGSMIELRIDKTVGIFGKAMINIPFGFFDKKWNFVKVDLDEKNISQSLFAKWGMPTGRYGVLPFIGPFYPLEIPDIILQIALKNATQTNFVSQAAFSSAIIINDHSVSEGVYVWVTKTQAMGSAQFTALRAAWEQYWLSKIKNKR